MTFSGVMRGTEGSVGTVNHAVARVFSYSAFIDVSYEDTVGKVPQECH